MTSTRGRCTNFDYCALADRRADMSVPLGQDFVCPECGRPLKPPTEPASSGGRQIAILAGVGLVVAGAGLIAYTQFGGPGQLVTAATVAPAAPAAVSAPVPVAAAPAAPKPAAPVAPKPVAPAPVAAAPPAIPETIVLRLSGSNTIGAGLGPRLAQAFLAATGDTNVSIVPAGKPDEVKVIGQRGDKREVITVAAHGSATAFTDLAHGAADIGMASRRIKPDEAATLPVSGSMTDSQHEHVLALDGIAVIVNGANQIPNLTKAQLRDIYTGVTTNWSQLGGPPGEIHPFARDDKSGTFDTFKSLVLAGAKIAPAAKRVEDSRALSNLVAADTGAIGFIGLPYVLAARAVPVAELGALPLLPNRLTVGTEDYALARRLFLYTATPANDLVPRFTEFALSADGQALAEQAGFVPLTVKQEEAVLPQKAPDRLRQLVGHATRLSTNFRFLPNSVQLDNRGQRDLDRLVNFLVSAHAAPTQVILVGFADNQGKPAANLAVSRKRAEAVAAGLAQRGVPVRQVAAFGADLPVADNGSDDGREKNRRVEVYLSL